MYAKLANGNCRTTGRLSQDVLRRLDGHSKQLSLYLLGEDGKRTVEGKLHSVLALAATVDPSTRTEDRTKMFWVCKRSSSLART